MQINGKLVIETEDISSAQFWIPSDNIHEINITIGKIYRMYLDKADDEFYIIDDSGTLSMAYMICSGKFYKYENN